MAQALKYWDGANPKIYVILTQKEDGGWHLACHWTDRILEYDCELIEDRIGQHLRYGSGSILPLRNSKGQLYGRWSEATEQDINDRPCKEEVAAVETEAEPQHTEKADETTTDIAELERLKAENEALQSRISEMEAKQQRLEAAAEPKPTEKEPQPKRYGVITESRDNTKCEVQSGSGHNILKAVGSVAAMTVALVVIWQTGLLIPLGLIGLAMSGIIK
jgi:hypothetical protein